jgi:hypothetical protein
LYRTLWHTHTHRKSRQQTQQPLEDLIIVTMARFHLLPPISRWQFLLLLCFPNIQHFILHGNHLPYTIRTGNQPKHLKIVPPIVILNISLGHIVPSNTIHTPSDSKSYPAPNDESQEDYSLSDTQLLQGLQASTHPEPEPPTQLEPTTTTTMTTSPHKLDTLFNNTKLNQIQTQHRN